METLTVHLYAATDAEESYAIRLAEEPAATWKAKRGFGQDFDKVWSVELQGEDHPDPAEIDWDAVMDRMIEAYNLSDPVIANFKWPVRFAPR